MGGSGGVGKEGRGGGEEEEWGRLSHNRVFERRGFPKRVLQSVFSNTVFQKF